MFFSTRDLEVKKILFDVAFQPGEIDFADEDVKQAGPLHTAGEAELLANTLGEIRVRGTLNVLMEAACDRCLDTVQLPVDSPFDLFYRPTANGPVSEELALDDGEVEMGFYDGDGVRLEDVLREHVLLSLPMQTVCKEECKGICPACGQNRNQVSCDCAAKPVDDRWTALRNLKTQLAK